MERKREKKGLIKSQVVLLLSLLLLLLLPASRTRYKGTLRYVYTAQVQVTCILERVKYVRELGFSILVYILYLLPYMYIHVPSNILLGIRAIIIIDIVMDKGSPSSS